MNVASLELCRELHKLSGWDDLPDNQTTYDRNNVCTDVRYDLGYLLRKLATSEGSKELGVSVRFVGCLIATDTKEWLGNYIAYHPWMKQKDYLVDETPENALCALAIQLFKSGILTPKTEEDEK